MLIVIGWLVVAHMFSLPQSLSYPNCRCLQKTNLGLYIERLGVLFLFNVCRSKQTNNLASQQSDRVGGEANGKERGRGWRSRSITCPVFRNNNMQSSSSSTSQQSNVLKRSGWSNCTKENRQLFDWRFVGGPEEIYPGQDQDTCRMLSKTQSWFARRW